MDWAKALKERTTLGPHKDESGAESMRCDSLPTTLDRWNCYVDAEFHDEGRAKSVERGRAQLGS